MCPWVGPHAPSFGRQLWGLPSRVEYLSPKGVLLLQVYGTTASLLWLGQRTQQARVWPSARASDLRMGGGPAGSPWI